jgi:hypothetical protein
MNKQSKKENIMNSYNVFYKLRNTENAEIRVMGINALTHKQAKFFFFSDPTRRKYEITNIQVFSKMGNDGDHDDIGGGSVYGNEYRYQNKKVKGKL